MTLRLLIILALSVFTLNACQTNRPTRNALALNAAANSNRPAPTKDAPPIPNSAQPPADESLDNDDLLPEEDEPAEEETAQN